MSQKGFLRKFLTCGCSNPDEFHPLLKNFEELLARRIQNLKPKNQSDVVSLSWMTQAIESLSETNNGVMSLMTDLQISSSDWDEDWVNSYLNDSSKLLDMCNFLNSEVSKLVDGQLQLQYAIRLLDVSDGQPSSEQKSRARDSILEWLQHGGSDGSSSSVTRRSATLENCLDILNDFVNTLSAPKDKTPAKGTILLLAMYCAKVQTILFCGVFVAALSRSTAALKDLQVPRNFLWSSAFMDVQKDINGEIRRSLGKGSSTVLKDLEAVDGDARKLLALTEKSSKASSSDAKKMKNLVKDLKEKTEDFSRGLDVLSKEVDGFFQTVMRGRDAFSFAT